MKNISKYVLVIFLAFILFVIPVSAREMTVRELGEYVAAKDNAIGNIYIIGEYAYTSKYKLDTQDIMLAARSINATDAGDKKGDAIFGKMTIFRLKRTYDDIIPTGWEVTNNYVGTDTIDLDTRVSVKYVDYEEVKNLHSVEFNTNDGNTIPAMQVEEGSTITKLPTPEKEGYDFVYWYKDNEENEFIAEDNPINEDITLKAKWEAKKYTITFDDDNVTSDKEVTYTYPSVTPTDKSNFAPTDKKGYTFDYWYDEEVGEDTEFNFDEELTKDVTLKAKWNANVYKITFEDDNVTEGNEVSYTYPEVTPSDKKEFKPTDKIGYTFDYWYDKEVGENTKFNFDEELTKDVTLKAKWNANVYTITFDDEYVNDEDKTASYTYPEVTPSDKKDFEPNHNEGFDFAYWYNVEDDENTPFNFEVPINKNITLKAKWNVATLTITFKNEDKTDYEVKRIKYNDDIEKPIDPEKDSEVLHNGYKFNSWHKCDDEECSSYESDSFDFEVDGKQVKEDIVLIATYDTVVYTNEIISDFVEDVETDDFTAYMVEDTKIQFNIVNDNTPLETNFNKFVEGIKAIVDVANVKNVVINYNETSKELTKSSNISDEFKAIFAALTGKPFDSSEIIDLDNATFKLTINLEDGYKNLEGNSNDPYVVTIDAENFETVNDEGELIEALKGTKEIIFGNDITINKELVIDKDAVIDGKNYKLISNINDAKYALNIKNGNVVLKDLTIKIGTLLPSEYNRKDKKASKVKNTIGAYVGSGVSLTVTNVNVISDVKLDATNLKMGDEDLHAYNVPINENAAIEVHGKLYGSKLTYQNEIYGSPIVLVGVDGTMDLAGLHKIDKIYNIIREELSDSSEAVETFAHYYADRSHTDIIHVLHIPNDRHFVSLFYIPNEKFVVPTAFTEGHKNNTYSNNGKNYKFDNKFAYYKDSKRTEITSEELEKLTVSDSDIRILTAMYREDSE